ncbi:Vacuole effluxer Atg22 like protein [Jannaschia seosinensis]|uniref:Vacuole effluxer Atg22 like protein n=1 Tax=Jannaschia seosinensis TaxID=313367 RepID=A0A0M7B7M5_9RHOB|nr:MFS transporter [Jannaschia seosinensis]CUH38784.1 Vacuole effluxer Atg22 like protein [Jannaschia seosinensis]
MTDIATCAPSTDNALRRRVWGWMMFDFASQPYNTLLLTFVFGPYFASAVMDDPVVAQSAFGFAIGLAGLLMAVSAPVLGAMADASGRHLTWIRFFSVLYVLGAAALWFAVPGAESVWPILLAFCVGLVGMEFATIFTNAMLPTLGPPREIGRISGSGWALGYVGGVLSLAIVLTLFAESAAGVTLIGLEPILGLDPATREGTRFVGPFTALWYIVFMVPFFLWVKPVRPVAATVTPVAEALRRLARTIRSLPARPSFTAYLGASMLYRDALNGLYTFGGIYTAGVLGWGAIDIGIFGIVAAITGAIFAWIGGRADRARGPKPVIVTCVIVLTAVSLGAVSVTPVSVLTIPVDAGSSLPTVAFYVIGAVIGAAGGALQASSRTMLVRLVAPSHVTEGFGLYALAGKATAFLAPMAIGFVTLISGSQRIGVLPVVGLFILGLILLMWVRSEGEHA